MGLIVVLISWPLPPRYLPSLQNYLASCKMAKQFWPEHVEVVTDLPRTASGKIQKFKLREIAAAFGDGK